VYEGSFFFISSKTPVVGGVFDDGYSNRGEVESFMARDGDHFFMCFFAYLNFFFFFFGSTGV
jgi:hypothetical protein